MNVFGLTANLLDLIFIVLGKSGKVLNAQGKRVCFVIDTICLVYWLWMDIQRGLWSQAASVVFGLIINVYGWKKWGKDGRGNK